MQKRLFAQAYRKFYEGIQYRMRDMGRGSLASWCRPLSIVFLLTERCNARCVHCDIWKNKGKEDAPSPEQWKKVLDDLSSWLGPVTVTFTGGEALLQPFTPDLVAHGVSRGLFLELLTHGYWSDTSRLERVARANPWRLTMSLDGIGETHSVVRGRSNFWDLSFASLNNLTAWRRKYDLGYIIRLKTVLMEQNIESAPEIAKFAKQSGMEVFYQPIEQNYNTAEDPRWYESAPTFPKDRDRAVAKVRELIRLKREGFPVANSMTQLEVMIPYFQDPGAMRVAVQSHVAHEVRQTCAAVSMLQFQANGDVTVCSTSPPVGNIKTARIRQIWRDRPHFWEGGCCLERRCTPVEKERMGLPVLQ